MTFPMKASGQEWLGPVPSHWAVAPLTARYEVQLGKMLNPEAASGDHLAPYLRNTDVQWGRVNTDDLPVMSFSAAEREKFALRPGDLLVCEGGDVGRTAIWRGELSECFYQKAVHRVRARTGNEDPRFLYYVMAAAAGAGAFEAAGNRSTIIHLTAEKLRASRFPFAPADEQRRIADFLDRRVTRIDELVAKKEALLASMAERRRVRVTERVLRGVSPGARTTDSGVPSLGIVPAHWRVVRNKVIFRETNERSTTGTEELLTVSHLTGVTPRSEKPDVNMFLAESMEGYKLSRRDDLVINTMWAWMGAVGFAPCDGIVSPSYNTYRSRTGADVLPAYFDLLFRTPPYVAEINKHSKGIWTSRLRLYPEAFLSMRSPVPPLDEQHAIVARVRLEDEREQPLVDALRRSVETLHEYRLALISSAVSGRTDRAEYGKEAA